MYLKFFQTAKQKDCYWTRTHNHLVHKRTLNHLAKLALSGCGFESSCSHVMSDSFVKK